MESTWETRDLVVLEAAVQYLDEHGGSLLPQGSDLAEITGLSVEDVGRAFLALDGSFLDVGKAMGGAGNWHVERVYPSARQAVGQWPTPETVADRIVAALAEASDRARDENERSLLKRTVDWFGNAGRDVLVQVAATAFTKGVGIG